MTRGSIIDFIELAARKPELARELVDLAGRHGFEFVTPGELDEAELDAVTGGGNLLQRYEQSLSSIMKAYHDTTKAIIGKI